MQIFVRKKRRMPIVDGKPSITDRFFAELSSSASSSVVNVKSEMVETLLHAPSFFDSIVHSVDKPQTEQSNASHIQRLACKVHGLFVGLLDVFHVCNKTQNNWRLWRRSASHAMPEVRHEHCILHTPRTRKAPTLPRSVCSARVRNAQMVCAAVCMVI